MRIVAVICLLGLAACATPYQPDGRSGGYKDREIDNNRYLVSFRGNGYTSQSDVEEYAFRRAEELCQEKGYKRFKMENKDDSTNITRSGDQSFNKHRVQLVISCAN